MRRLVYSGFPTIVKDLAALVFLLGLHPNTSTAQQQEDFCRSTPQCVDYLVIQITSLCTSGRARQAIKDPTQLNL